MLFIYFDYIKGINLSVLDSNEKKKEIINYFISHGSLLAADTFNLFSDNSIIEEIYSFVKLDSGLDKINSIINKFSIQKKEEKKSLQQKESPQSENKKSISFSISFSSIPQHNSPLNYLYNSTKKILLNSFNSIITSKSNLIKTLSSYPSIANTISESSFNDSVVDTTSEKNIKIPSPSSLKLLDDYHLISQKREVAHFVSYFSARHSQLSSLLRQRKELSNILSIGLLKNKKDRDTIAIIGLIRLKEKTKNNHLILTLEDPTGEIKVLVNKANSELFAIAQELVQDEVIGVIGTTGDNILFSNQIIQPDIPLDREYKKYHKDEYVLFLSDTHVGSNYYLANEFRKFLSWIRGETGTEKQKDIASKVKYIFIAGDIVDGVGIYPNQEKELDILDIYDQYKEAASLISQIPPHIQIIICPGNHDALRLSEPQPKLSEKYAKPFYELPNVTLVSNPAFVNICSDSEFSGFDILIYHGYSFDYYISNVDSIRQGGGYDRADLIMKFLLKRRHLAPTYSSTLFIPEIGRDHLIIDKIPDFFITGHIHKTAVSIYRNTTLICGSCWQAKTSFQEKMGHHPEPARVPVVNLRTRKVTVLNFEK
jgi:DNA polymerase II small subunit